MKKFLSTLGASFALVIAAFAGPLDTSGIPADVIGVLHVDLDAAKKNPAGEVVRKYFQNKLENPHINLSAKGFAEFKDKTGFNPLTDIYDITLGIVAPEKKVKEDVDGTGTDKDEYSLPEQAIVIVRGKFDFEKIQTFFAEELKRIGGKTFTVGKYLFYDNADGAFSILDNKTILYIHTSSWSHWKKRGENRKTIATAALAALSGKAKSFVIPDSLLNPTKQPAPLIAFLYGNLDPLGIPKPKQDDPRGVQAPDTLSLTLVESAGTLKLRGVATYPSESEAQQFLAKAQMGVGFLQMGLAKEIKRYKENDSRKMDYDLALEISKVLSVLKVRTDAEKFNASLDYPATDLAKLINDYAEISARNTAAIRAVIAERRAKEEAKAAAEANSAPDAAGN